MVVAANFPCCHSSPDDEHAFFPARLKLPSTSFSSSSSSFFASVESLSTDLLFEGSSDEKKVTLKKAQALVFNLLRHCQELQPLYSQCPVPPLHLLTPLHPSSSSVLSSFSSHFPSSIDPLAPLGFPSDSLRPLAYARLSRFLREGWSAVPLSADPLVSLPADRVARKRLQVIGMVVASTTIMMMRDATTTTAAAASARAPVLIDFCGGGGHVGLLVAFLFPHWNVVIVDLKEEGLRLARQRASAMQLCNLYTLKTDVRKLIRPPTYVASELAHGSDTDFPIFSSSTPEGRIGAATIYNQVLLDDDAHLARLPIDVGVALHACGPASTFSMQACLSHNAGMVICPCCVGKISKGYAYTHQGCADNAVKTDGEEKSEVGVKRTSLQKAGDDKAEVVPQSRLVSALLPEGCFPLLVKAADYNAHQKNTQADPTMMDADALLSKNEQKKRQRKEANAIKTRQYAHKKKQLDGALPAYIEPAAVAVAAVASGITADADNVSARTADVEAWTSPCVLFKSPLAPPPAPSSSTTAADKNNNTPSPAIVWQAVAKSMVELDRLYWAAQHGYAVRLAKLKPLWSSPKNDLLVAWPAGWQNKSNSCNSCNRCSNCSMHCLVNVCTQSDEEELAHDLLAAAIAASVDSSSSSAAVFSASLSSSSSTSNGGGVVAARGDMSVAMEVEVMSVVGGQSSLYDPLAFDSYSPVAVQLVLDRVTAFLASCQNMEESRRTTTIATTAGVLAEEEGRWWELEYDFEPVGEVASSDVEQLESSGRGSRGRKLVHMVASQLGCGHYSKGQQHARRVVVVFERKGQQQLQQQSQQEE